MAKTYVVLLKNNYILFLTKKPKKKGNYTHEVRLFETSEKTTCQDLCKWVESSYSLPKIKEIENWD